MPVLPVWTSPTTVTPRSTRVFRFFPAIADLRRTKEEGQQGPARGRASPVTRDTGSTFPQPLFRANQTPQNVNCTRFPPREETCTWAHSSGGAPKKREPKVPCNVLTAGGGKGSQEFWHFSGRIPGLRGSARLARGGVAHHLVNRRLRSARYAGTRITLLGAKTGRPAGGRNGGGASRCRSPTVGWDAAAVAARGSALALAPEETACSSRLCVIRHRSCFSFPGHCISPLQRSRSAGSF
jgi:hypothetical protein